MRTTGLTTSILDATDLLIRSVRIDEHDPHFSGVRPRSGSRAARWSVSERVGALLSVGLLAMVVGCDDSVGPAQPPDPRSLAAAAGSEPASLRQFMASTRNFVPPRQERFEVWVCEVPLGTADPTYAASTTRVGLDPSALAQRFRREVTAYFEALSHDRYAPDFVAGGVYAMSVTDSPQDCLDAALDDSDPRAAAVLAVGTAEHAAWVNGGFGGPGSGCPPRVSGVAGCSAAQTRRGAYVGASDFHPAWGDDPPMDLVEHEIGHTLGWPHSGSANDGYASGLDVMSNSAARRLLDDDERDAQGTLAVNQLASRWLSGADVLIARERTDQFLLAPSDSAVGVRLLILPVDDERFLSVEYRAATGLDEDLPTPGVTLTLVDQAAAACGQPENGQCLRDRRAQLTLVGTPPYYDLLTLKRPSWAGYGWSVQVRRLAPAGVSVTAEVVPG